MKKLTLLHAVVLLLACSPDFDPDLEAKVIRAQLLEIAAISGPDRPVSESTEEYLSYFSEDPTLLPPNAEAINGRDAITRFYNDVFDGIKILSNKYENAVIVVDGHTATRRYLGTATFLLADDEEPVTAKTRYIDVLTKENGEWRMLWHSWVPVTWE